MSFKALPPNVLATVLDQREVYGRIAIPNTSQKLSMQNPIAKPSELRKHLFAEVDKKMNAAGFNVYSHKSLQGFYDCEVNSGCNGVVILCQQTRSASFQFGLIIGTRVNKVEELVDKFLPPSADDKKNSLPRLTISCNLGYVSPSDRFESYEPTSVSHLDSNIRQSISTITDYGSLFFKNHCSTELVYQAINRRGCSVNWASLPIIYFLMNEQKKAITLIQNSFLSVSINSEKDIEKKIYGERLLQFITAENY